MSTLARYSSAAFITSGGLAVAANADIEVRLESDNSLAAIFADRAGATPIAQPGFQSDAIGRFSFCAPGIAQGYRINVTKGAESYSIRNVMIGTAAERDITDYAASVIAASTAAAMRAVLEFPALGSAGQAIMMNPSGAAGMVFGIPAAIARRQTVRLSSVDASGAPNFISAGAGLNFNVEADPDPIVIDFADGRWDYTATVNADASNQGSLAASNINIEYADYVSPTSVTWGSCLVPPQYGYAFDRAQAALLNFNGTDASTTILDDIGNTWTAAGNAQLDTAQSKFGTASLLLDGTGDYIQSTDITSLGDGSWEISLWARWNVLPTSGTRQNLLSFGVSGGYGLLLGLGNIAGTTKMEFFASGDGASWSIANQVLGSNTTWATATWYKFRLVFDALAGTYRLYLSNNGAAETQDITVSSTARLMNLATQRIGGNLNSSEYMNGWIDAVRIIRCATKTTTETPSASAPTIADYPLHFFSIPKMVMYEATAASASAGTNPTFTTRKRVFVGEQDTNGSAVTATRCYALRGEYFSTPQAAALGTPINFNHNLGTDKAVMRAEVSRSSSAASMPADKIGQWALPWQAYYFNGATNVLYGSGQLIGRNTATFYPGSGGMWAISDDGNAFDYTHVRITVQRSF